MGSSNDADSIRKLDAEVQRLRANLCPTPLQQWELDAARDAELRELRLKCVQLESMLNDCIDEKHTAQRAYLDLAADFDEYRRTNAATGTTVRKARRGKAKVRPSRP